jgi:hypothetical protein
MKLYEMFSPIGAPKENDDIDWIKDLKFFIDNDNTVLNRLIFPTIVRHERCVEEKDAYKLYYKPIKECLKIYIKKYDIVDADKKFPTGQLVELCKNIAEEQKRHILNGDYKNESIYEDKKSVAAETIDTVKGGYKFVSEKTGDNLSTYPTRTGAVEAERRIQIFKSRDK